MSWLEPKSETIGELAKAFGNAQAEFPHAPKGSSGVHGKYADLPTIIETVKPILREHGLHYLQPGIEAVGGVRVQTILMHSSGEWIADGAPFIPATKQDAQGFGSAMTYARRYGLAALLGLAQDDDDGKAAVKATQKAQKRAQKAAAVPGVPMASDEQRGALEKRIQALPDSERQQVGQAMRAQGMVWKSLTAEQHGEVCDWVEQAEAGAA